MNKLSIIGVILSSLALLGCQSESSPEAISASATLSNTQATHSTTTNLKVKKLKLPCKGTMPPIRDKSKLKQMLINSGKITPSMSDDEANQIVSHYIKKKRAAFDRCKK